MTDKQIVRYCKALLKYAEKVFKPTISISMFNVGVVFYSHIIKNVEANGEKADLTTGEKIMYDFLRKADIKEFSHILNWKEPKKAK